MSSSVPITMSVPSSGSSEPTGSRHLRGRQARSGERTPLWVVGQGGGVAAALLVSGYAAEQGRRCGLAHCPHASGGLRAAPRREKVAVAHVGHSELVGRQHKLLRVCVGGGADGEE